MSTSKMNWACGEMMIYGCVQTELGVRLVGRLKHLKGVDERQCDGDEMDQGNDN